MNINKKTRNIAYTGVGILVLLVLGSAYALYLNNNKLPFGNTSTQRAVAVNNGSNELLSITIDGFSSVSDTCVGESADDCTALVHYSAQSNASSSRVALYVSNSQVDHVKVGDHTLEKTDKAVSRTAQLNQKDPGFYTVKAVLMDDQERILDTDTASFYVGTNYSGMDVALATSLLKNEPIQTVQDTARVEILAVDSALQKQPVKAEEGDQQKPVQEESDTPPKEFRTASGAPVINTLPNGEKTITTVDGNTLPFGIPAPKRIPLKVNFGQYGYNVPDTKQEPGYTYRYRGGWSYGWSKDMIGLTKQGNAALNNYGRNPSDGGFVEIGKGDAIWKVYVPNGDYAVRASTGNTIYNGSDDPQHLMVNGQTIIDCMQACANTINIRVESEKIEVYAGSRGLKTRLNLIEITPI